MNKEQQEKVKIIEDFIEQIYQQGIKNAELKKEKALLELAQAIL